VVIHNFDIFWTIVAPAKADSPLLVDADTELPKPISLQRFQVIARRDGKGTKLSDVIQLVQLSQRNSGYGRKPSTLPGFEQALSLTAPKAPNHKCILVRTTYRRQARFGLETSSEMVSPPYSPPVLMRGRR